MPRKDAGKGKGGIAGGTTSGPVSADPTLPDVVARMPYGDLVARKEQIKSRLNVIALPKNAGGGAGAGASGGGEGAAAKTSGGAGKGRGRPKKSQQQQNGNKAAAKAAAAVPDSATTSTSTEFNELTNPIVPFEPKTDVHWDFVMKEMMWLGADFQAERKTHLSTAKKVSMAVKQFHKSKESRRIREMAEFELRRRRLANRMARDVNKGWWNKIERVIAYKQKVNADASRRKAMDKHLVFLVKQTERYGKSLAERHALEVENGGNGNESDAPRAAAGNAVEEHLTIEEALASADMSGRRSKKNITDYNRVTVDPSDSELYGTSTADDSDDYELSEQDEPYDDVTTLVEAERMGNREEEQNEAEKLMEESEMDIEQVLKRLREEAAAAAEEEGWQEEEPPQRSSSSRGRFSRRSRRVQFSPSLDAKVAAAAAKESGPGIALRPRQAYSPSGDGSDADDDADASDVEDFDAGGTSDGSDEFEAEAGGEIDDESTLEAEERMGRDMSYKQEIDLLNQEAEMSVEELRAMYAPQEAAAESASADDVDMDGDDEGDSSGSEEFVGDARDGVDDETTLEAEERLGREMSAEDEINMLNREAEMSVEELRAMYAGVDEADSANSAIDGGKPTAKTSPQHLEESAAYTGARRSRRRASASADGDAFAVGDDDEPEEEFEPERSGEVDDETTLDAEERLGRDMSYQQEIDLLKKESEMSLEELRAMYAGIDDGGGTDIPDEDEEAVASAPSAAPVGHRARTRRRGRPAEPATASTLTNDAFQDDDGAEDDEFRPETRAAIDDEGTLEAEEQLGREMSPEEELEMLKRQSEVPVEELRAMYAAMENGDEKDEESGVDEMSENDDEVPSSSKRKRHDDEEMDVDMADDAKPEAVAKKAKLSHDQSKQDEDGSVDMLKALEESEERARQTMVSRPFLLAPWVKLREYQQIGLNWLVSTQGRRLNGILADEMGLGKTLQTISLLAYLACYKGIWGPHLIIVPTSCLVNWESEIKRFCPGFKVLTYYGTAKRRKELRVGWTKSNWNHVVVTSYQLAVQDAFAFRRKKWYYLILDEAHNIKNFQSQRWQTLVNFNTQRRLLLTGTPLQNNLMELWSLLHFLMPHIFRSRKEFSYWFSNPMNNIIEGNSSRNDDLIGRLHGIIRPFVLRRLKKDVEQQMPGKYEHIVKCQLSRRQMFLYEEFMARSSTRVALKKGGNYMGMMNVLMQLRKVCNHPDLFEARTVVTPFFMEPIALSTAGCVINATESLQDRPSSHIMHPLWSCGGGIPDFASVSTHDQVKSSGLVALKVSTERMLERITDDSIEEPTSAGVTTPGLARLLDQIWTSAKNERLATVKLQSKINSWRCESPTFPFSERTVQAVLLEPRIPDEEDFSSLDPTRIASTPKELMAMRRSQQQRADDLEDLLTKFVFCVPKAGSRQPKLVASKLDTASISNEAQLTPLVARPLESYYRPFRTVKARLTSFFPDKKLIQYDAGKLQTLSTLLYDLKRGGHRVLIFTQMSKMLDILEAFLNLHGHTYLRLDGGTGVDKRQRLMDRFNNDTKVFCFILSTRSGGLGINLTGADTVVFYDSDWNPAMDAQAQDRAHRIGQTRDVHIYRLVTEHSIEENILVKAKQKRHLDFLVMDEGKFHSTQQESDKEGNRITEADDSKDSNPDVFTKGGLRDILGVKDDEVKDVQTEEGDESSPVAEAAPEAVTKEQVESAMASLEDEDDAVAMRNAQKEAAEEMKEFDESVQVDKDDGGEESPDEDEDTSNGEEKKSGGEKSTKKRGGGAKKKGASSAFGKNAGTQDKDDAAVSKAEEDMEKEFAEWQSRVGVDMAAIDSSLRPTEQYGLRFREEIDPFYSAHFYADLQRQQEATTSVKEEWNVEEIEQAKEAEERRALEEGDLLATLPLPEILPRQRHLYVREKARLRADKKRRKLTGENWGVRTDPVSGRPYWFNGDTGEAIWDKPAVLLDLEAHEIALKSKWSAVPIKPLLHIMTYLIPFPERMACSTVCRQWRAAANDFSFVRHVLPVEMGVLAMDERKMEHNHFRTIADALAVALPGDMIELGDGHYWVKEPGLKINVPVRIIGDEKDPSHVTIELSGTVTLDGVSTWMEGVSFRRPRIASGEVKSNEVLQVINGGRFDVFNCVLDNEGAAGNVARLSGKSKGSWTQVEVCGADKESCGLKVESGSSIELKKCHITHNHGGGIYGCDEASIKMWKCHLNTNDGVGLLLRDKSQCQIEATKVAGNRKGNKKVDGTSNCVEIGNDNGAKRLIDERKATLLT